MTIFDVNKHETSAKKICSKKKQVNIFLIIPNTDKSKAFQNSSPYMKRIPKRRQM